MLGEALAAAGETEAAAAELQAAADGFATCGMRRAHAATARAIRRLGGRVAGRIERPAADRADALAALTAREREIARLVAAGAANKEIGAALHLSQKTVANHLTRIYAKLDLRHRTELAALATGEYADEGMAAGVGGSGWRWGGGGGGFWGGGDGAGRRGRRSASGGRGLAAAAFTFARWRRAAPCCRGGRRWTWAGEPGAASAWGVGGARSAPGRRGRGGFAPERRRSRRRGGRAGGHDLVASTGWSDWLLGGRRYARAHGLAGGAPARGGGRRTGLQDRAGAAARAAPSSRSTASPSG